MLLVENTILKNHKKEYIYIHISQTFFLLRSQACWAIWAIFWSMSSDCSCSRVSRDRPNWSSCHTNMTQRLLIQHKQEHVPHNLIPANVSLRFCFLCWYKISTGFNLCRIELNLLNEHTLSVSGLDHWTGCGRLLWLPVWRAGPSVVESAWITERSHQ